MIRKYNNEDIVEIEHMFKSIVEEGEYFIDRELHKWPFSIENELGEHEIVYVYEKNNSIIGLFMLSKCEIHGTSHVVNVIYLVKNKWRNQGIGSQLIKHSFKIMRKQKFKQVLVRTVKGKKTTCKLWENMGFSRIGNISDAFECKSGSYKDVGIYQLNLQSNRYLV